MFSSLPKRYSVTSAPRPADGRPERIVSGMDVALVERAEHDVDDADRDEEQQAEVGHRLLEDLGRPFEAGRDGRRQQARRRPA